jgi:hypothetical protein
MADSGTDPGQSDLADCYRQKSARFNEKVDAGHDFLFGEREAGVVRSTEADH